MVVTVNNDDNDAWMNLPAGNASEYVGTLTGQKVSVESERINVCVHANSGEIWVPAGDMPEYTPVKVEVKEKAVKESVKEEAPAVEETTVAEKTSATKTEEKETASESTDVNTISTATKETAATEEKVTETPEKSTAKEPVKVDPNKAPEDMTVEELQAAILAKMANNGPVTDQMKKTVDDNIWHDSLVNWLKSFR